MRDEYDVTFWQNSASIHQAPLIGALAADGLHVRVVIPGTDNVARQSMGWHRPDYGGATVCTIDDIGTIRTLAASARDDRAHVFTGLGSNPAVRAAFRTVAAGPRGHLSVMTESWDPRGVRGSARRARYALRVIRSRRNVDSILAMGDLAAAQFTSVGFPPNRIAQFTYSVSRYDGPVATETDHSAPKIVFVGSLEAHKDPLLLVNAVSSLEGVQLTLVGSGTLGADVTRTLSLKNLERRVRVIERLENSAVRELLAGADLLVLPSRYDGWGAVTNEALMAGTPAVVSDRAGSSRLVANSDRGRVFRAGSLGSLTAAIREELAEGPASLERRGRIRTWSRECISPEAVALYLRRLLLENRYTVPPWLAKQVKD